MATNRVTVYDNRISGLIRTGEGNRWTRGKANEIKRQAVMTVPIGRTYRLAVSHGVEQSRDALGRFSTGYSVYNDAPHAAFVHGGTGIHGPRGTMIIYSRPVGPIWNPAAKRGGRMVYIRSSKGQVGQPWLREAAETVLARG